MVSQGNPNRKLMTNLVCFLGFVVSSGEGDNEFTGSKIKMHFLIIVNAIVCTAVYIRFMLYMYIYEMQERASLGC